MKCKVKLVIRPKQKMKDYYVRKVRKEEKLKKKHELQAYLQGIQENKIILNTGGTRFETSKGTFTQDPKSLFALLFADESPIHPVGNSFFIDRDPAHFRFILNYLQSYQETGDIYLSSKGLAENGENTTGAPV